MKPTEYNNSGEFNLTFSSVFKISDTALLINGSHPKVNRGARWLVHYIFGMAITWFITILICNSITRLEDFKNNNFTEACRLGTVGLVGFIISYKYCILLLNQDNIMELIRTIDRDYERARALSLEEQRIVKHYAERGVWVSKLWFLIGTLTSSLFPIKAITLMLYSAARGELQKNMVFELYIPGYDDVKYENYIFIPLFIGTTMFAAYAGTMYIAFDPLIPIFLLHCCGQLQLASIQIDLLFAARDLADDDVSIRSRLNRIIEHLQHIYRFLATVRKDFAMVYEMILRATTILIPITLYEVIETMKRNSASLEFISFEIGCFVHFYTPCYYSDLLMNKSLKVGETLYSCGWERQWDRAGAARRSIAFMLARANKPLCMITAFGIMSLDSFTQMCRQSYAIFSVMNAIE